ncbi:hypothetical protein ACLVWU_12460 [Bdellovibrio sp. HCB290]|uniref:hypothetical protein n=1 Tax=Bdellovibrio sp. HCB290 TaxID=3394356 RepID=UPI0039B5144F
MKKNNTFSIGDRSITFLHKIMSVDKVKDGYLVILNYWCDADLNYSFEDNIYKLNDNLEIQWQIQGYKPRCYVGIFVDEKNFRAISCDGMSVETDMATGKTISEKFVK